MAGPDAFSQGLVKKYLDGNRPPVDDFSKSLIEHALKQLPGEDLPVTSSGRALPDWDIGRHFVDALTDGHATGSRDSTAVARAKAEWSETHPGEAWNADIAARTIAPVVAATILGRVGRAATSALGAPELGEALTGAGGSSWPIRALSGVVSGAWQGALPSAMYPDQRENLPTNILTGAGLGGAISLLMAPLRASISPEMAQRARDYMAQGMPLGTSQIPGAPLAARVAAKVLGMGHPDRAALTGRIMRTLGSNDDQLNYASVEAAKSAAGANIASAARAVPALHDPAFDAALTSLRQDAHDNILEQPNLDAYLRMHDRIQQLHTSGMLDGNAYQKLTQKGGAMYNAMDRTSPVRYPAIQLRNAMDDAIERANPQAADDIRLARNQYRNAMAVEGLENEDDGVVDPKKLYSKIKSSYGGMGQASAAALNANNAQPDIGVLAGGGRTFDQGGFNPSMKGLLGGGLGVGAVAMLGEHEGLPILDTLMSHPVAGPIIAGALGTLYAGGGALQNTPIARNILLSGGPGFVANPLIPAMSAARSYKNLSPETAETEAYIRSAASARGIDPDVAVKVARSEGLGGAYAGDEGSSFGPFQLHYGNVPGTSKGNAVPGLGDLFTKTTGLHASDPSTTRAQIDFALDQAVKSGWGPWHGWTGDPNAGLPSGNSGNLGTTGGPPSFAWPTPQDVRASNPLTGGP
jgi:hypothetical protein